MSGARRFKRRNRVDEPVAAGIGLVAGIVAALAGAEPTGGAIVDGILVTVLVGFVVWAAASAPWWAPAAACGVGAAIAFDPVVAVVGAVGFVVGLMIGVRQQEATVLRTVVAAVAMNVLIWSELGGFHGLSAIIGVAVAVMLVVAGLGRRPAVIRRRAWIGVGAVGAAAALTLLGVVGAAAMARPDLADASNLSEQAIATLNAGDYEAAADQFSDASRAFQRADDHLSGAMALPSRLIPGVAQNVRATAQLSAEAAEGTGSAADALDAVDPSTLSVVDGAIDLEAVAAVEVPLVQVQDALTGLRAVSDNVESPWLVVPIQDELDDLYARLDANEPRLENAIDAVRLTPQMLGADGERRYLILFTTPAEARGLGGFVGNYAEISVDNGQIALEKFGRTAALNDAAEGGWCAECPTEYVDRYGRTGLTNGPGGVVGPAAWSNLTFGAHFPYIGETAQVLYPQSGGTEIDGVFVMDPYVVEAMMQYTGPIEVPELGVTVQPDDAAEFILQDQYVIAEDRGVRVEALDTLGRSTIDALLTGALPAPAELARDLGPLIAERRLLMWTDQPDEQDLLERTSLLGSIPGFGDDGGFSISLNNRGESKIDVFVERQVETRIETDADGNRRLVADVTITNTAPTSGLPAYVIGNNYGEPDGTNMAFITFYGPPTLDVATRNGEPISASPQPEAGWIGYGFDDIIGPGETVDYHVEFTLEPVTGGDGEPVVWYQPLAQR